MADDLQSTSSSTPQPSSMFNEPPREKNFPTTAVAIAAVALLILVAVLFMLGRRDGKDVAANQTQAAAAYASNLAISNVEMSESTSVAAMKSTFIDGHIANHGTATVTGITVQTLFANDQAMPPQVFTQPLTLVRTREPYVDVQPVSAAPLAPGAEADFRLIYEGINANWNGQKPELRFTRVATIEVRSTAIRSQR